MLVPVQHGQSHCILLRAKPAERMHALSSFCNFIIIVILLLLLFLVVTIVYLFVIIVCIDML